ncbi:formate dehydrogenase major subunit [Geothermobacter ehrlichii]|nr:formate dehydrogenase major subunit [Geothermobacter ehrlichii]
MTNHWIDIRNSDVILVMGSNAAENHPISFRYVLEARERGAKLLSVDPRFTRTSARADVYAPLRSGTDIAFLGGMINYILENGLYHREYLRLHTNATFLVDPRFRMPGELDGLFSGYNAETRSYDKSTWGFQRDENGVPRTDPEMEDPNCVFQLLKKHFSRYTLEVVSDITGTPVKKLEQIYRIYGSTGRPGRAATIMYAMGWTQHTVGTQNIRTMAIIQLLLGNIGVAGGGVNALRGESNVQGSTDHCLLFHILPGYLPTPKASLKDLATYIAKTTPTTGDPQSANWWGNRGKYITSLLRAHFDTSLTAADEFGYQLLPKLDDGQNASWLMLFDRMIRGQIKGFFAWGQNPACSGSNANKVRRALARLDWMVVVNLFDNETASFWKGPGMDPARIDTEVFFLPVAASFEKEGSVTNSGRWAQWRYQAVEPLGDSRHDSEIMNELYFRVRQRYAAEGGAFPDPILKLSWNYGFRMPDGRVRKIDIHAVAREINGYFLRDKVVKGKSFKKGDLVPSFAYLQDDGSTSSGNWLYCQSYNGNGNNMARRSHRDPSGIGLYPEWAWCWPVNRRILYNRASVNADGVPWDRKRPVIWWTGTRWEGDVPDGGWKPLSQPGSKKSFIMLPDGVASIFGAKMKEGPFPEHYEPLESPIEANPLSGTRNNPAMKLFHEGKDRLPEDVFYTSDKRYPFVATTYRVTEHWQTGVMSRNTPWLLEMQPQLFVELSPELARERGIGDGEKVRVSSGRGSVEAIAIVTRRFRPFRIRGKTIHQVGLPWCFGWSTPNAGDSANLLTPTIGDANTMIPETKAFMVNVEKLG